MPRSSLIILAVRAFLDLSLTAGPFSITHSIVQKLPNQPPQTVCDCPDGSFPSQTRQQPAKYQLKDTSFHSYCALGSLIQQPPQIAVPFGRTAASGLSGSLFLPRTDSHPGREIFRRFEIRCVGSHFRDDLLCRIDSQTGHFRQALHRVSLSTQQSGALLLELLDLLFE